jgi:hypothetical protein
MSYFAAKNWNNPNLWRVIWRKYTAGTKKPATRHIPEAEYRHIGVTKEMTFDEVKAILKKVNLELIHKDREDKRNAVALRMAADKEIECIHLPGPFVEKFENDHLATRYSMNPARLKKVLKLWRAGQKIIRKIKKPVDQWHRYPEPFFKHFVENSVSPGYAKNILSIINIWIDFLGQEQGVMYRPIPAPSNDHQSKINDAFDESGNSKASLVITPEMLDKLKTPLKPEQFNWVYCTVWLGLRPNEATALLDKKRTEVVYGGEDPVLKIYQSKLKNVPKKEDRWKYIPLGLPQQLKCLDMIASGLIEEPLAKTLSNRFGEGHTLYGGRKGFHELMVGRYGQPELEVCRWLGHKSLDMAMKHYAKKDSARWLHTKKAS